MSPEDTTLLTELLKEKRALKIDETTPLDYASLKSQIINQELQNELEKLSQLLEEILSNLKKPLNCCAKNELRVMKGPVLVFCLSNGRMQ
ncbi:hypothetical protein [Legionella clemsonensis]|uniref:Uncharacterized protein n=1 Tax=Legionella clemsonensis TaxID=1867846 RepID=A0A222P1G9_9GAMM|nr:hypothetical protein [Legionella clemsonensis]ASQ45677.1 hypothetical protein clem_05605 [Legionella clemsonensis]